MASSNLGDLEMSLTLKTRIEDEIKKVVRDFNQLDATGRRAQEAVDAINASVKSLANGKGDISSLVSVYKKLNEELTALQTLAQKDPINFSDKDWKKTQNIQSVIDSLGRLQEAIGAIQKGSGLSIFPNNISTESNKAALAIEKVRSVISELGQWNEKATQANLGIGATRDIRQAAQELQNYLAILEKIKENGGTHPTAGLAASDITRSAEYAEALNKAKQGAKDLQMALKDAADAQERLNKQVSDHNDFVSMKQEAQATQELNERLRQQAQLKADIIERDRSATEHGTFMAMKQEAQAAQELNERERELANLRNDIIQRNNERIRIEERVAAAIAKTNQTRRETIAESRKQAEALVRDRAKELEAQQKQLRGLYSKGKGTMSDAELAQIRAAYSQITQEVNRLRAAMSNLGSYSIKDLFAFGRGTSDYAPLINNMSELSRLRQSDNAAKREAIELEKRHQQEIAITAGKVRNDLASAFASVNSEAGKTSKMLNDIKSLFLQGGIVFGAQQFFNSIVQTGGEIVQQHVALRSILGDVQKADELFAQTQQLALQSPFKFGELNRDVKQLAAFGVEANDLYDTTKRLADIASGLGVSFERLGLAYGQVKARSWLDGKELRQFAYAGLPLLQKIAELYNSTGKNGKTDYKAGDVKKMITNREVSFEDVQKVLWQMTDQGGQFYNMQLVLSDTLLGRWNKLIDAWDIMTGKMAEGKSVIGGTFSFFINRVTDLVLALDKMQPALLALGGMFALKKGAAAIGSAIGVGNFQTTLQAQTTAQLRTYAIEQQRLVVEGQITREQAKQNIIKQGYALSDSKSVVASYERLALEGRLNALQLQKAVRQGLITKELVQQLEIMGLISAKESELIVKEGTRARASLMAREAGSKIGGFLSGWNIATIGVTIAGALYSAWSAFDNKIKQDTETTANNAKSTYESMVNTLKEVGDKKSSGEALQEQVDKMTETLKQSNLYTDSIKEQIASTNDLGKEYDILKGKIEEAAKANNFAPGEANAYAKAKAATGAGFAGGGSWFGQWTGIGQDDIDENTNDVATALASLQMKMEKFGDTTKKTMEQVANSMLGAKAAGMTLEEKLATLYKSGGDGAAAWQDFVDKVSKNNGSLRGDLKNLGDDLGAFGHNFQEITTDDIPKYLEEMAKSRNMSLNEFSQWCKDHPEKFRKMLDEMLSEANTKVPSLVARLQQVAKAILNIGNTEPKKQGSKPKVWKNPLKEGTIDRKAFNKLLNAGKLSGGKGNFYQKEMAELIYGLNNGQSTGWENFGEAVRKKYKEVRNENDAAKAAGEKRPYVRRQEMLEAIAGQLGIDLDVDKNKVTGNYGKGDNGNKKDKALETWKERLKSYQDARKTYEQYKDEYGEEETKAMIKEWYGNISDLDMEDYAGGLKKLQGQVLPNTAARKKFFNDLTKEIKDFELSNILKPEMERIASDFKEALEQGTSQFNLYKKLFEKTGSKEYASQAFKRGEVWDDNTRSLRDQFEEMTGLSFNADISDSAAKKYLKEKMGAQGDMAYDLWKQTADLVHENYTDALEEGAEALSGCLDYATQILIIVENYKHKIEAAEQMGNTNLANVYRKQQTKELGKVNWSKFSSSTGYTKFFQKSLEQGKKYLSDFSDVIKGELKKALDTGAISAEEYADKLQEVNDRMNYDEGNTSFFGNGLSGLANKKKEKGEKQLKDGVKQYQQAKDAYDKLVNQGQGDSAEAQAAQNDMAAGKSMMDGGAGLMQGAQEMEATIGLIDTIIHGINDIVQGMYSTFEDIKETAEALGANTDSDGWTDAETFFSSFSSASQSATDAWDSAKEGNVGGVIQGVVGSFTGWIKGFAQGHDKKLENQIKILERQETLLKNISDATENIVSNTLGGIYNFQASDYISSNLKNIQKETAASKLLKGILGITKNISVYSEDTRDLVAKATESGNAYDTELASLYAQRDVLQKQYVKEGKKKNSDDDKLADYEKQLEDLRVEIENFSESFLKDNYSIDLKSWASELTDAVVSAWEAGEDAVDAYQEKVKEMVKEVTKSIVAQKYIETALKAPLAYLESVLEEKGQLDETDIDQLASQLYEVGNKTIPQITDVFDALKERGWDLTSNSASSTTNSVKGITEETADLLASYLNAIRLDVSVNRDNIKSIADAVTGLPDLNVIAKSQLTSLNQLVSLAEARNSKLDDMYAWMRSVTSGTGMKSISVK